MPTYFSISHSFRAVHSGYLSVCSSQTFSPWIIYSLPVYAYLATSGLVFLFLFVWKVLGISFNRLHRALTQTNLIIDLHGGVSELPFGSLLPHLTSRMNSSRNTFKYYWLVFVYFKLATCRPFTEFISIFCFSLLSIP